MPEKSAIIPKLIENENLKLKETLAEKEELLSKKEDEIRALQLTLDQLTKNLAAKQESEAHFCSIFTGYENILTKIVGEHNDVIRQKQALDRRAKSLEASLAEVVAKYEHAKLVIRGLVQNENILKSQLKQCEKVIDEIGERYVNLQEHATEKLNRASARLDKNDKKHIAETAKLKAKILQSKVIIHDLEKQITVGNAKGGDSDLISEFSMFAPLKNHLIT